MAAGAGLELGQGAGLVAQRNARAADEARQAPALLTVAGQGRAVASVGDDDPTLALAIGADAVRGALFSHAATMLTRAFATGPRAEAGQRAGRRRWIVRA